MPPKIFFSIEFTASFNKMWTLKFKIKPSDIFFLSISEADLLEKRKFGSAGSKGRVEVL